ncbi:SF1B family DNA helicase RecD2 [Lentibacillus salinarum]|uniref:ATP-dependent RecD2 DNA helicase n=1 Tax=Lentibacillus salinarum TaxID=446820 RepID=A0ABW3ZWB3_9BACI
MTEETYTGTVSKIIYRNDDFLIARFSGDSQETTIKGSILGVKQGEKLTVYGNWEHHAKYGKQFAVTRWERPLPKTDEQAIAFLASPLIKGCGEKRAKQIVNHLGTNALERIADEGVSCLTAIKGIGEKKAQKIADSVISTFEVQKIIGKLLQYGISAKMAMKLYKEYGSNAVAVIEENPYKLTELNLVGFHKADEIAKNMGITPLSGFRINACVQFVLKEKCFQAGHCYLPEDELIEETLRCLNHNTDEKVTNNEVIQSISNLEEKRIVNDNGFVYPKFLHEHEMNLSWKLAKMQGSTRGKGVSSVVKHIKNYQKQHNVVLAEKQREAIRKLFEENLLILTGNPGTGKTTVVQAMIDIYKKVYKKDDIALCAPTGRASRKLAEVTGHAASTIHRLIGLQPGEAPQYSEDNPLSEQLIIIDEMSMVDVRLASKLMAAIQKDAIVLFVGDADQLPSVNPGNVLKDMIEGGIPNVKLTEIFRQAQESQIVTNAHRINQGQSLLIDDSKNDFYFIQKEDPKKIAHMLVKSAVRFVELGYALEDILVLSPIKKGPIGTITLNEALQETLNPASSSKKEWKKGNTIFRQGDKVIQTKNNYDKDVFNGDIGTIKDITQIKSDDEIIDVMICDFMGEEVEYTKDQLNELQLAYCITIHKSQGGQAPVVIIPVSTSHYIMLARNLIYTGMTRAEERMVFIGTKKAMHIAAGNNKVTQRNTKLAKRILSNIDSKFAVKSAR